MQLQICDKKGFFNARFLNYFTDLIFLTHFHPYNLPKQLFFIKIFFFHFKIWLRRDVLKLTTIN